MWTRWLATLTLCSLTAGCHLANNAVHNLTYEAKLATGDAREHCNYEKLAHANWESVQKCEPRRAFSKDYAKGFKEGFVDYLQFGGSGQPPYVPPKHYWGPHYRTPEGYRVIEDWYAGFRHGVTAAQQSGYRQWVPLPSAQTTEHPAAGFPQAPGHPSTAPVENNGSASSSRIPPSKQLPAGQAQAPGEGGSSQSYRTAPLPAKLGAPISPQATPTASQLFESAPIVFVSEDLQSERPNARQLPAGPAEVITRAQAVLPRPASAAPDLAAPKSTTATALVAEPAQVLDFSAAPASFGRPSGFGTNVRE